MYWIWQNKGNMFCVFFQLLLGVLENPICLLCCSACHKKSGWRCHGNKKCYRRSDGVKTTRFFGAFQISAWVTTSGGTLLRDNCQLIRRPRKIYWIYWIYSGLLGRHNPAKEQHKYQCSGWCLSSACPESVTMQMFLKDNLELWSDCLFIYIRKWQ